MKLLGFVFRTLKDFNNINVLRDVYCAIVRSLLEYESSVWSPYYNAHIALLEKVQRKFLRVLGYKIGLTYEDITYVKLHNLLNLKTLESRRKQADFAMLFKIINGIVDSSDLLNMISFHVLPRYTRYNNLFNVNYHITNYAFNNPLDRFCRLAIEWSEIALFSLGFNRFKTFRQLITLL